MGEIYRKSKNKTRKDTKINNVLNVTLDIVENVLFFERAAVRASTMNLYIIFVL